MVLFRLVLTKLLKIQPMRYLSLLLLLGLFTLSACKNGTKSTTETNTKTTAAETKAATTTNDNSGKKYTLTPFTASQNYIDARIKDWTYYNGEFNFDVSSSTYKLGAQTPDAEQKMCANSGKGQHIHLIIDNKPYAAKYEAKFPYEIEDGEHYMLAFLSRSYHESIKNGIAFVAEKIEVKNNESLKSGSINRSMVFYSRPKGTYVGKANTDKVMLDFYIVNCKLGENDYKVKAEINGEEHLITNWVPYYIEGLPMGENKVKLTLLEKDGDVVDVPHNPVERTFTLKADPIEE